MANREKTTIPPEFMTRFEQLNHDLEQATGNQYQTLVQKYGTYPADSLIVGSFENRDNYIVYDMKEKYKDLEGEYGSIEEIKSKIEQLKFETVWSCYECGKSTKLEKGDRVPVCLDCNYMYHNIWVLATFNVLSGNIYLDPGGISFSTMVGKVRFN